MDKQERVQAVAGRWLRRLSRHDFARLMGASLESVLLTRARLAPEEARRLRWEVLRGFESRMAKHTRRVRALTRSECLRELEKSHGALLRERLRRKLELAALEHDLAQAGCGGAAVLAPAAEEALARALAADLTALLAGPPSALALEALVTREGERRAAALAGVVAHERELVQVLERRLAKLRAAQLTMERSLAELARRAAIDGGLPSIYRDVQGLADAETEREAKAAMLLCIFEQNVSLQRRSA